MRRLSNSSLALCRQGVQGVQGVQDITCHPCIFRVLEDSVLTDICLELPELLELLVSSYKRNLYSLSEIEHQLAPVLTDQGDP